MTPLTPLETGLKPQGRLAEKPKAFLFDVYGTLLISASGDISGPDGAAGDDAKLAALLKDYGLSRRPAEVRQALAAEITAVHDRLREKGVDYPEVEIDRVWQTVLDLTDRETARRFAAEYEMIVNPVYPMPATADLLAAVRHKNITAGIVSNAQFYTGPLFKLFFGDLPENDWAAPDLIFYSFQYGRAKPSPFLYEQAAAALAKKGIAIGNTLYIGNDMLKDIRPAAALGFKTALFAGDARSLRLRRDEPACRDVRPDLVITGLEQLIPYM